MDEELRSATAPRDETGTKLSEICFTEDFELSSLEDADAKDVEPSTTAAQRRPCGSTHRQKRYLFSEARDRIISALSAEAFQCLHSAEIVEQARIVDSGVVPARHCLGIVRTRHPIAL